jgi:hypothetical protein
MIGRRKEPGIQDMVPRDSPAKFTSLVLLTLLFLCSPLIGHLKADDKSGKNKPQVVRVLFVGNSLTFVNNVPGLVQSMAASGGIRIEHEAVTPPGVSLEDQWRSGEARKKLASAKWDYVVLQQGPSSRPDSQKNLREWGAKWAEEARAHGAKPAFYMVWPFEGQKDGFKLVAQAYRDAAKASQSLLLPAGDAWAEAIGADKSLQLYTSDKLHPTLAGSYLAALVITSGLTDLKPSTIPSKLKYPNGQLATLPDEQAKVLRQSAEKIIEQNKSTKSTISPGK